MPQGTIKKLTDRGFGFISTGKADMFFHMSSLQNITFEELHEGQTVEFDEQSSEKGPCAVNIRVMDA